ncbi:proton-coupled folate transporter-like [Leptidea sinapis]|uniref:proton-coupled folate transporter-like n=1 Tax=Leptidea sinapis TaxID=189913 RepID=UPI0021465C2D|nr:proton-coupled folate transporter-like [Leptidea sinapis]
MATKVQSELELSEYNKKQDQNENADTINSAHKETRLSDRFKSALNFFTVEPFLLCYILPSVISAIAVQKLNMEKACRVDLGYSEDVCSDAVAGNFKDNLTISALDGAQVMVADMTTWQQPIQSGIPAIVIIFVGAWSDKTGNRKSLMLIPILGELISAIGLIFTTYFFLEWPLWVTGLIESVPSAFTGGRSIALMGSYSYIADVTTIESRTFRVGVVAVIVTLGIPLGSSVSGVLTESVGYYGIFTIGIALYAFGFVHTYFQIHDVKQVPLEGTLKQKIAQFFNPKNAWDTFSLLFLSRGKKLAQILLVIWAHIVVIGPIFGEGAVLFLYTLKKFNMDVIDFSLFSTYSVLMGLAGTTVAVTIFSKLWKMHDALIGSIATICKVVSSFVYGFATNRTWFYTGPVFDFFGNSGTTVIRSLGTKVVDPDEVGKMCSLIGFVEAVVPVIYTPIYSKVYSTTLDTFPGAFYLLGGMMTVPAVLIFVFLYIMHKREMRDVVKNPAEKEIHAHENHVTVL